MEDKRVRDFLSITVFQRHRSQVKFNLVTNIGQPYLF